MIRTCDQALDCPPDQPLDNFSSEGDDTIDYISTFFPTPVPTLLQWVSTWCGVTYVSTISQLDADLHARSNAELCNTDRPGTTLFLNTPQTCCVPCPDGTQVCYEVPGGLFSAINQQAADDLAHTVACDLVNKNQVCLSNIPGCGCFGGAYSATVTISSPLGPLPQDFSVIWELSGGTLPPGLTVTFTDTTAEITGILALAGTFTFQLKATTTFGPYAFKNFAIVALQITTNSPLPAFTIGVPYSFQLQATGGSGNYLWKIVGGTLPPGLTLSNTGLISGTPT